MPDGVMLPEEAAEELRVHPETVMRWLRAGKMRGIKLPGGTWRITRAEVDRILMQGEHGGE